MFGGVAEQVFGKIGFKSAKTYRQMAELDSQQYKKISYYENTLWMSTDVQGIVYFHISTP